MPMLDMRTLLMLMLDTRTLLMHMRLLLQRLMRKQHLL
jgi:hypothetical protein